MKKIYLYLIAALGLLGIGAPAKSVSILPPPAPGDFLPLATSAGKPTVVPGQVIVQMKPGNGVDVLLREAGLSLLETIPELGVEIVAAPEGEERAVSQALSGRPDVQYAEPNGLYYALTVPNDTYYTSSYQWYLPLIHAPAAWDLSTGSADVTIADLDTGADTAHPDLKDKLLAGYNAITRISGAAGSKDDQGHGTFTSGIAAAISNNSLGVSGVSWGAKILPVKVLDSRGSGSDTNIAAGIRWAADHGAKVLNLSLGGEGFSQTTASAVTYAYGKGCLIVAAMGNEFEDGNPTEYPAAYPSVMAVGATSNMDERSSYSNTGGHISVVAPGGDVVVDNDRDVNHYIFNTYWNSATRTSTYVGAVGTSAATPVVSGLAALLWSVAPNATPLQIRTAIEQTAKDLGAPGKDDETGYGRIDAFAAMQKILESVGGGDTVPPTASITTPASGATVSGSVTVKGSVSDDKGLRSYQVQYGVGASPTTWTNIGLAGSQSVTQGTLATWNTTAVADGTNTLRVTVQDTAGNSAVSNLVMVMVSNAVTTINIQASPMLVQAGQSVSIWVTPNQSLSSAPTVTATGTCIDMTPVSMSPSSGMFFNGTFVAPAGQGDCDVTFTANGTDAAGKAALPATTTVHLDRTAPVAQAQSWTTSEDQPVTLTLNATDLSSVTYSVVTQPSHGSLGAVNGNQIVYTPAANYNGPDSFTFRANDGSLDGAPATLSLTVTPVNDPPVATNVSAQTGTGKSVAVTLTATDPDGDALTYSITTPPQNGILSGTTPNLIYTPNAGFVGSDSFGFIANDGQVDSAAGVASLNVVSALLVVGSGEASPGGVSTLSISLTEAATNVTAIDVYLRAKGSEGAPALIPSFTLGAQNADWTVTPDPANPLRFLITGPAVDGPAEVLKLTLQVPSDAPPGSVYTLEAAAATFAQDGAANDVSALVQPGHLTVGGCADGLKGDINGDGSLNVKDVVFLLRTAVGLEAPDSCARATGDVDLSSVVDLTDAVLLLQYIILAKPLPS